MAPVEFLKVKNALPELRRVQVDTLHGIVPKSIEYLETAISSAVSAEDKAALYPLLISECVRFRNHDLHVHFLREQVRDLPDDPLSLSSLATALSHDPKARDEALRLVALAVDLSLAQNRQVKYNLTCQARIALQVGEYAVFHKALRGLIEDASNYRPEDHVLEFDFLDHLDQKEVDQKLVSQYRALSIDSGRLG